MNFCLGNSYCMQVQGRADMYGCIILFCPEDGDWGLKSNQLSLTKLCMESAPRQPPPRGRVLCCNSSSLISHLFLIGTEALGKLAADLKKGTDKMFYSKNHLIFVMAEFRV